MSAVEHNGRAALAGAKATRIPTYDGYRVMAPI